MNIKFSQSSFTNEDSLKIYSNIGQEMYETAINSNETTIDLSIFAKGIYILSTNVNGVNNNYKVVKE